MPENLRSIFYHISVTILDYYFLDPGTGPYGYEHCCSCCCWASCCYRIFKFL